MARIKGFAIRGLLRYVKTSSRPGGIPAVLARLPAPFAEHFKSQVNSSAWYPYEVFGALLRSVDATLGKGDLALVREIGLRSAVEDSGTIFKIIATIASVETIVRRSPIFWQKYCDTGLIDVIEVEKGHFRVALKDFPGIDEAHCRLITGWIEGMAQAAASSKTLALEQVRCVHRRDPWCEYEGRWAA